MGVVDGSRASMVATPTGPLQMKLTIGGPSGGRDVAVSIARDATVTELMAALGEGGTLVNTRTGAALDLRATVLDSGLRSGDRLVAPHVARAGRSRRDQRPRAAFEVRVVGGPGAGERRPLEQATLSVGRSSSCDLTVADRSISRHHLTLHLGPDGVAVEDMGSSNGTSVEGVSLTAARPRPLAAGEQVALGRTLLSVHRVRRAARHDIRLVDARLAFNRPPRLQPGQEPTRLRLGRAPDEPGARRIPWIVALAPMVLGVGFAVLMQQVAMLAFAALTPVMVLGTHVSDRRGGRQDHARAIERYRHEVATLEHALAGSQLEEIDARRRSAPDPATLAARATDYEPELWERRPRDEDFLELRVGVADQPSRTTFEIDAGGQEALRAEAESRLSRYATVPAVPATAALTTAGTLGLSGEPSRVAALARWLVVQAAVLHSPSDVIVAAALSRRTSTQWSWLKWLPHLGSPGSPLPGDHAAVGSAPTLELLRAVAAVQDVRREEGGPPAPRILLVIDESVAAGDRALVSRILDRAPETGVGVVWMGADRRDLPGECGTIAHLDGTVARLRLVDAHTARVLDDVSADGLALETAGDIARSLHPVTDAGAATGAAGIPSRVGLLEVLSLRGQGAHGILERWGDHRTGGSLTAPLGIGAAGPYRVDLRSDGPHALIAGTTGAGKSELLQTLVATLAATQPPDRLTFLLVDYKGGTAFRECARLPHAVGMVTDLDEHLAERALASLNAELRRREHILREAGAGDLLDMERRHPADCPPSLVIVVDEFAALAREVPAFVDGVVDIAQRGRALGLHLVLATQRPSGVISESIRANTNLRIALRVASPPDSEDVIATRDAALVPRDRPGRAYARVGHNELTAFQSAYGGEAVTQGDRLRVVVTPFDLVAGGPISANGVAEAADDAGTQLEWLVAAVGAAADQAGIVARSAPPWLPELPPVVPRAALAADHPHAVGVFGVIDEPARQRRLPLTFDPEVDGSMLVFGAAGAGKSTLLRTLAGVLAERSSSRALWLYVLDFGGRGLSGLEVLPQCGAVVAGSDEERIARLLTLLRRTVEERRRLFAEAGVLTLDEYRRRTGREAPAIVVFLHDYGAFVSAYERISMGSYVDAVPALVADGRAVGVHFLLTAERRSAVPPSLLNTVARRLVLRMASKDEYAALGLDDRAALAAATTPGRGFTMDGLEVQVAVEGERHEGESQLEALAALGRRLRGADDAVAPGVASLPATLDAASLPPSAPGRPLRPIVGVSDEPEDRFDTFRPFELDLEAGHALVAGPYRSGRSTVLATLAACLAREGADDIELHLLSPRTRTDLDQLSAWTSTARGTDACAVRATELAEVVRVRDPAAAHPPMIVMIDDAGELTQSPAESALSTIVRHGRDVDVRVIVAVEAQTARTMWDSWFKEVRKEGQGLLLTPDPDQDGMLLGVQLPRHRSMAMPPGRGYNVDRGQVRLVQIALPPARYGSAA